jgi:hypothetical protein
MFCMIQMNLVASVSRILLLHFYGIMQVGPLKSITLEIGEFCEPRAVSVLRHQNTKIPKEAKRKTLTSKLYALRATNDGRTHT